MLINYTSSVPALRSISRIEELQRVIGWGIAGKTAYDYITWQFPALVGHIPVRDWFERLSAAGFGLKEDKHEKVMEIKSEEAPVSDAEDLAMKIARSILRAGNDGQTQCKRIQFMVGPYPDGETTNGGFKEHALACCIRKALEDTDRGEIHTFLVRVKLHANIIGPASVEYVIRDRNATNVLEKMRTIGEVLSVVRVLEEPIPVNISIRAR